MDDERAITQFVCRQGSKVHQIAVTQIDNQVRQCLATKRGKCGCQLYGHVVHCCKICDPDIAGFLRETKARVEIMKAQKLFQEPASASSGARLFSELKPAESVIDLD